MAILRNGISGASARHEAAAFPLPAADQRGDIHDTDVHQGLAAVLLNPGIVPGGVGHWLPRQIKLSSDAVKNMWCQLQWWKQSQTQYRFFFSSLYHMRHQDA